MGFQAATEPTGVGSTIRETSPTHCPQGHALVPPNVQVIWGSPGDLSDRVVGARRGWRCWECREITWAS